MTDYVFEVMKQFPQSFINYNNELILIPKTNLYVCLHDVNTPTDLKFKLLEYCSRECTNFTQEEMELVYDVLGNGCNHKLAKRFVSSGYDMKLLEEKENE